MPESPSRNSKMYNAKSRQTPENSIDITLGGIQMDPLLRTALWQRFDATIDMLENAMLACPSTHWHGYLWSDHSDYPLPPESTAFWYITFHTLFWLDLYLTGSREGFAPPTPFTLDELDPEGTFPEQPYTKDELHVYLASRAGTCGPIEPVSRTKHH